MKKRTFYLFVMLLTMISITATAQEKRTVSGVVNDETGAPLSGVSIFSIGGKPVGITNTTGTFSVSIASSESALKFTSVGYADTTVNIEGRSIITIVLRSVAASAGTDVVVTALGIQKNVRDLAYVAQKVSNADLTTVKDANFSSSLAGKAANITITQGSGGVGSATNIILRGNNSLSGNGSPLIVIDGIPVVNNNTRPSTGQAQFGENFLAPDQLSTINPSDVEEVTILKGATAAALYGSQAANGAIIITTKSGKDGKTRVNLSSNTTFQSALYHPQLQTEYMGSAADNGSYSWGDKNDSAEYAGSFYKDLLQTGLNTSNSIDITTGTKNAQLYAAYAYTNGKGLIPNNTLNRNNFDLKGTTSLFDNFIEFTGKFSYIQQVVRDPYGPGQYLNPYFSFMSIPANTNMALYKNNISSTDSTQNWPYPASTSVMTI